LPFNGTGLFERIYQWVNDEANGLFVDATRTDTDSNDIADGLSNCITRDGQSPATNDIPMGENKITGLAAGSVGTDAVNFAQVFVAPSWTGGVTYSGGMTGSGGMTITGVVDLDGATSVTVPTRTPGDNGPDAASTAFVVAAGLAGILPGQSGNAGREIVTDGASASWGYHRRRDARTANTILGIADNLHLVDITSGTFSQTFTAAATLGNGWSVMLRNSGTGDITLDPSGAELIDGLASYVMYPQECRLITCDGTGFTSVVISPYFKEFATVGANTWTKPPGYVVHEGEAWSAAASGERTNDVGTQSRGGAGGGCYPFRFLASSMGATETITNGAGGVAVTTVAAGNAGGDTTIGALLTITGASHLVGGAVAGFKGISSAAIASGFESVAASTGTRPHVWGGTNPSSDTSSNGNTATVNGGGCGGSVTASGVIRAPGTSKRGGAGGAASIASNGTAGTVPGGGGGATQTGTASGAGADAITRIWGIA